MCCYRIHARIWGEDLNLLNSHSKVTENTSKYATPPPLPIPKQTKISIGPSISGKTFWSHALNPQCILWMTLYLRCHENFNSMI